MRLILDRTVVPADGTPITGFVQVTNTTGKPVPVANDCDGFIGVGLSGHEFLFGDGRWDIACPTGAIPEGTSRTSIAVVTSYSICLEPGGAAAVPTPRCIGPHHLDIPPLPPGHYLTKSVLIGVPTYVRPPAAITVTLVPVAPDSHQEVRSRSVLD